MTGFLTEVRSNAAATVLAVPIAIDAALRIGSNPHAFVMAIVIAASTSFLMPIGHQVNVLVYGPGGYQFFDYTKVGIWLNFCRCLAAGRARDPDRVGRSVGGEHLAHAPARTLQQPRQLVARKEQVVEPRGLVRLVPYPHADLTAHPALGPIPGVVREVDRVVGLVGVERVANQCRYLQVHSSTYDH